MSLPESHHDRISEHRPFIEIKPDVDEIKPRCRFCANYKSENDLLDLNLHEELYSTYLEMLKFLKMDYVDFSTDCPFPKITCIQCSESLEDAYMFLKKVEQAQETLLTDYDKSCSVVDSETTDYSISDNFVSDSETETRDINNEALLPKNDDYNHITTSDENIAINTNIKQKMLMNEVHTPNIPESFNMKSNFPINLFECLVKGNYNKDCFNMQKEPANIPSQDVNCELATSTTAKAVTDEHMNNVIQVTRPATKEFMSKSVETQKKVTNQLNCNSKPSNKIVITDIQVINSINSKPSNENVIKETQDIDNINNKANNEIILKDTHNIDNVNLVAKPILRFLLEPETNDSWDSYNWVCFHCNIKLDTMDDLRTHSKDTHSKCYGFKCVDCRDDFNTFNSFVEHVRRHRKHLRNFCEYCNQRFNLPSLCLAHALTHWSGTQRACEHCGELFPDQLALERHRKAYKKKGILRHSTRKAINLIPGFIDLSSSVKKSWLDYEWTCHDCNARLPDVGSLRVHSQQIHFKCFTMKCVDCLFVRTCFKSFVTHVQKHRPILTKFCEYCNVYCSDSRVYSEHLKTHDSPAPVCPGCGHIFSNRSELRDHVTKYNTQVKSGTLTKDEMACQTCQKKFTTIHTLKAHIETHNDNRERPFICDTCGISFLSNASLRSHLKGHIGKTVECSICNFKFVSEAILKRHMLSHSTVKPFICDNCKNNFRTKSQLRAHMKRHYDYKPFKCIVCKQGFKTVSRLNAHMPQHTGLMKFSCEYCGRKFSCWANCNKHMMRKHGVTLAKTKRTPTGKVKIQDRQVSVPAKLNKKST